MPTNCCPWKIMVVPVLGSARAARSGSAFLFLHPREEYPAADFCSGIAAVYLLQPPPLPDQAVSEAKDPSEFALKLVPPTATTYWEEAGDSASAPLSPADAKIDTPLSYALSRASSRPLSPSGPPKLREIWLAPLSTQVWIPAARSSSLAESVTTRTIFAAGAIKCAVCTSKAVSTPHPSPLASSGSSLG
eukprot:Phypoly_transcript_08942.p1 GENE.Phypoly_transcript_08942~~Phypoly_transcript_08942.p1  ORF type:complete len:190 (-),score=16.15 Phypoly_transcript_08942:671-1240(-)